MTADLIVNRREVLARRFSKIWIGLVIPILIFWANAFLFRDLMMFLAPALAIILFPALAIYYLAFVVTTILVFLFNIFYLVAGHPQGKVMILAIVVNAVIVVGFLGYIMLPRIGIFL